MSRDDSQDVHRKLRSVGDLCRRADCILRFGFARVGVFPESLAGVPDLGRGKLAVHAGVRPSRTSWTRSAPRAPLSTGALAVALREQLIQVAFARASTDGKHEKMELLYRYLAGDQFRSRVQAIVEAFTALQSQLNRERVAMERIWKEREKQIERALAGTAGMYGEVRGILGSSLPQVPALELDPMAAMIEDMRQ